MTIKFRSKRQGPNELEPQFIEFKSKVEIATDGERTVYDFVEPSNSIRNVIELESDSVSIFAGPTTVFLEYQKEKPNWFVLQTPDGQKGEFEFFTFLEEYFRSENKSVIQYRLYSKENGQEALIGNFELTLEIEQ
ncbi:hypothetical protein [Mycoplasmopsis gallinacea]|uniref:Uncharacterized protein n=1 Tax=Mycoplasmopsis gallinacea TaxID=29556 RepID=A0A449A2J6_9BACT|nr:hypothetical protein [Mycoplasmopsis gallinacea]VEU58424.1 Uncharacterised protein [Mycoplasmopsis gallinacea]